MAPALGVLGLVLLLALVPVPVPVDLEWEWEWCMKDTRTITGKDT